MKMWHIVENGIEKKIEVGPITILKGSSSEWYTIARAIEDFFNNKKSEISIYEDTQLIHTKDWECLFIPYDANLQLNKFTIKSPLKTLLDDVCNEISMSPLYQEFLDAWEDLREEMNLIQNKLVKYELGVQLKPFEIDDLKSQITFHLLKKVITPIQYKKLLLTLFSDRVIQKKTLIIIEFPELYTEESEFLDLMEKITVLLGKGFSFILITQKNISGNLNYIVSGKNKILNEARIENLKRKIINEVPFYCEEVIFDQVKQYLLKYVDNYPLGEAKMELSTDFTNKHKIVLFVLLKYLDIGINIDITDIPVNLEAFVKSY